jgi:addiction module RelE/StbE family toxin
MAPFTKIFSSAKCISYGKHFYKDWKHLQHDAYRQKFIYIIPAFIKNPTDKQFRNHELRGIFNGLRSINITGDIRAIYTYSEGGYIFLRIGTHSHLYG